MRNLFNEKIHELFDLKIDTEFVETDLSIRKNVDFKSANSWTLAFAIFIASVGLNTNSSAVIIGAMLISPLMGPIVGAGYALGVNDFDLLKRSTKNIFIAVLISLFTSTLYFLISPISEAQPELLARTYPSFYDVLIAAFGGAAGIIALSRKEKSNVIPGVAISTALMPPLCTAGYGLGNFKFQYAVGALYLFIINAVFISISTYLFVRYLRFQKVNYHKRSEQKRINRWVLATGSIVIIPSLILAWFLMEETKFKSRASSFIENELKLEGTFVLEKKFNYDWGKENIKVTTVGDTIPKTKEEELKSRMSFYGLQPESLEIIQLSIEERINRRITKDQELKVKLASETSEKIRFYETKINELELAIKEKNDQLLLLTSINKELEIISPKTLQTVLINDLAYIIWKKRPLKNEKNTIEKFLNQRLNSSKLTFKHLGQI